MPSIRHLAVAPVADDLFLTAEFERRVSLWSSKERRLVAEFDTVLDFGGRRLALAGSVEAPIVVAGAWERHGICGYDVDGSLLWQRKDLKKPQRLAPALDGAVITAGFDDRPLQILEAMTGETVATVRAVRGFTDSPSAGFGVGKLYEEVALIGTDDWKVRWKAPIDGFATLAATATADAILVSVAGAMQTAGSTYVVCLGATGDERWRWPCPPGSNVQALGWDAEQQHWLGFLSDTAPVLLRWSPEGDLLSAFTVGEAADYEFLPGGRALVATNGDVYDPRDGSIAWQFLEGATGQYRLRPGI